MFILMLLIRRLEVDPPVIQKIEKIPWRGGGSNENRTFFMLLKRRSEVEPPPPPPGHQNFWSKSLSEHRFKAQIPSKITKIFVNREPSARGTHFWGPSAPKSGSTHPASRKKIWETTPKNHREQGFHSADHNCDF